MPGRDIPDEERFEPDYTTLGPETFTTNSSTTTWTQGFAKMPKPREPKLVFIHPSQPVAYFSLSGDPRGDDWNDSPYEHNAGLPYDWTVRVVYLDTELITPRDNTLNSEYSVDMINAGTIAWLRTPPWAEHIIAIQGGCTVTQFIEKIHAADGIAIVVPEPGERTHMGDDND